MKYEKNKLTFFRHFMRTFVVIKNEIQQDKEQIDFGFYVTYQICSFLKDDVNYMYNVKASFKNTLACVLQNGHDNGWELHLQTVIKGANWAKGEKSVTQGIWFYIYPKLIDNVGYKLCRNQQLLPNNIKISVCVVKSWQLLTKLVP